MAGLASPIFPKRERIVSRKLIEQLFSKGSARRMQGRACSSHTEPQPALAEGKGSNHSISAFPLRIVYMEKKREEGEEPVQILVSVSKRHFKRAVKRNRVKRQIREAYRHHKQILADKVPQDTALAIAFIWLADELFDSLQVNRSVKRLLEKVAESV